MNNRVKSSSKSFLYFSSTRGIIARLRVRFSELEHGTVRSKSSLQNWALMLCPFSKLAPVSFLIGVTARNANEEREKGGVDTFHPPVGNVAADESYRQGT